MNESVTIDGRNARIAEATNGRESFVQVASGNILPDDGWFMRIAHDLWGDNAPKWIRSLTGFPERTCRSAGNGHTDASSHLVYALLRGEQGERVYLAIMDGCTAPWWIEFRHAANIGRQVLKITK